MSVAGLSASVDFSPAYDHGGEGIPIQRWSSLIGIVTAIVGNILISFALNIQRYAHIRMIRDHETRQKIVEDRKFQSNGSKYDLRQFAKPRTIVTIPEEQHAGQEASENDPLMPSRSSRPSSDSSRTINSFEKRQLDTSNQNYLRSPYWWAGILLMTVGEIGNFLAYGFAPASIVSPLGVVALISNCMIAPIMLKEHFRARDFWGVMTAVAGAVIVVLSAKTSEKKLGPHEIWDAINRWEFELYLGITICLIILGMWASGKYGGRTVLIDLGLVGLFGAYTALSTKGVASLLSYTFWRIFTFPVTYLLLAILISTAMLQIRYVNRALQRFDSTQVIPTQFVMFTLSVIIGSAVLYRDFEQATPGRVWKFIAGCACTFLGVYLITSGRDRMQDNQDLEGGDDEEDNIDLPEDYRYETPAGDGVKRPTIQNAHRIISLSDIDDAEGSPLGQSPLPLSAVISEEREVSPSRGDVTPRRLSRDAPRVPQLMLTPEPESHQESQTSKVGDSINLLENPWHASDESLTPVHGKLKSTTSSPVLPSEPQDVEDRPLPTRSTSNVVESEPRIDPSHTPSRRSLSQFVSGPLSSPLSSLSALVADSRRRGLNTAPRRRRRGGSVRESPTLYRTETPLRSDSMRTRDREPSNSELGHSEPGSSFPKLGLGRTEQELSPLSDHRTNQHRRQSLGTTITDLFRTKRVREESQDEWDVGRSGAASSGAGRIDDQA